MKKSIVFLLSVYFFLSAPWASFAVEHTAISIDYVAGQEISDNAGNWGYEFRPLQDIYVTHLGFFDSVNAVGVAGKSNGLLSSHSVSLWKLNPDGIGIEVVHAAIASGSDLEGFYRYERLATPVMLSANVTYVIGASGEGDPYMYSVSGFSMDPLITGLISRKSAGAFKFPDNKEGGFSPHSAIANFKFITEIPQSY